MMLSLLILLLLFSSCKNHEYSISCTDTINSNVSFEAADHEVAGRYTLKWCTSVNETALSNPTVKWESTISIDRRGAENCKVYDYRYDGGIFHSTFEIALQKFNCTNICMSTLIDLVYTSCYIIDNQLITNTPKTIIASSGKHLYSVSNGRTREDFLKNDIVFEVQSYGEDIVINIFPGSIPITDFILKLCNTSDMLHCARVEAWCRREQGGRLTCRGRAPPARYDLYLDLKAPWIYGTVYKTYRQTKVYRQFLHSGSSPLKVAEQVGTGPYWALGAASVLAVGGAVAAVCWWRVRERQRKKEALKKWQGMLGNKGMDPAAGEEPGDAGTEEEPEDDGAVLLLYARDCAPFMAAMAALRDLLRRHTHCPVYDLTEPRLQPRMALAPTAWVRGAVRSRTTRVVLVQNAAAVWTGAGASYRRPAHTDSLLQYTLRMVLDAEHEPRHYRKYYIAALSCVPAEALPTVAPYRRYMLPDHAAQLLQDLSLVPTPATAAADTAALRKALQQLECYVRANPNYIQEELLYVP